MEASSSAVTARGVIAGEPAALAALAQLRGPSVLAYCERVAAPGEALRAASEALSGFRCAAIRAPDPLAIDPEALLIGHTRRSAAALAAAPAGGRSRRKAAICADVPALLAAEAENTLGAQGRDRLRRHLSRCLECREAKSAQLAAERAYRRPSPTGLAAGDHAALLAALTQAGAERTSHNGDSAAAVEAPDATAMHAIIDSRPAPAAAAPGHEPAVNSGAAALAAAALAVEAEGSETAAAQHAPLSGTPQAQDTRIHDRIADPDHSAAAQPTAAPELLPAAEPAAAPELLPAAEAASAEVAASAPEPSEPADAAARPQETQVLALGSLETPRPRGGPVTRILAPALVVLAGLAIVLAVAGVFSSSSSRRASGAAPIISPASGAPAASAPTPRLPVPHGGPLAPAIPPGTPLANLRPRSVPASSQKSAARSARRGVGVVPAAPPVAAAAPRPVTPAAPQVSTPARPAQPKSSPRALGGSQVAVPPSQSATTPAPGGFQPSK